MSPIRSPYRLGAERGVALGVMLCAQFFALVYSSQSAVLGLVGLAIFFIVPFWVYRRLRLTYVEEGCMTTLSGLWMQGLMIFACGSAICAVVSIVYMKWINPTFIVGMLHQAIDYYRGIPGGEAEQMADVLQRLIDLHAVPTPAAVAVEMMLFAVASGATLSILLGIIAQARGNSARKG